MRSKHVVLICGVLGLTALGVTGMITGNPEVPLVAVGALAGLVTGHLNGSREQTVKGDKIE